MGEEANFGLERLAGGERKRRDESCPAPDEWASLAAGLVDAGQKETMLQHAGQCDGCGALLHAVMEDFSPEEDRVPLESFASSRPKWQREMAGKMAGPSTRGRVVPFPVKTWLARAAAVVLAAGAGWMGWNYWAAADPERLIARAYTQQRPFDFRVGNAENAPVRVERGAANRPAALIEAEAAIAGKLERDPSNPRWLALRARVELMEHDSSGAIANLDGALKQKPGDPDLLADLGAARAVSGDYADAAQMLVRSLEAKPDNAAAVFNLALVYQRMESYADAERQWRRYLELDKAGAWNSEARTRLAEVERRRP
jgi:cytochrome c-type biogenesis protein CcmH/NrfG